MRWRGFEPSCGGDCSLIPSSSVRVRGRGCDAEALPFGKPCHSLLLLGADEWSTEGVRIRRGAAGRGDEYGGEVGDAGSESESDLRFVVLTGTSGVTGRMVLSLKSSG